MFGIVPDTAWRLPSLVGLFCLQAQGLRAMGLRANGLLVFGLWASGLWASGLRASGLQGTKCLAWHAWLLRGLDC